jgi:hypothetical protein
MGAGRRQRAGETENGTERLATSVENRSYLTALLFFLVFLVQLLEKLE